MWYACVGNRPGPPGPVARTAGAPPCGHRERFWNSRDGVTPFGLNCPSCEEGILQHVEWNLDRFVPGHIVRPHQGVWVDMPYERHVEIAKHMLARAQLSGHLMSISPEEWLDKTPLRAGEPMLVRADWRGEWR